jgi:hypothetical protein
MCNKPHEERTALAQRQECLGRHVEHQPILAEDSEGQVKKLLKAMLCFARGTPKPLKPMALAAFNPFNALG